ncbi:phosphoenolpyruvate--protein phosphotransferase [Singulisphaera acidiphila]|uniref:Phosphoenolpyruvate-protein phosphotransferase n=1 Tax=Singulisphaera acidiphila (strain ATCC BAA-1392 / DSM 18658 / VKM B-2454 / MOB10) TaxID=886293 RepID=L0DBH8_SINAD|nr:phosphoenolpyruvate--protein phosphotransferase [Singulisphaera acidiphila]AGA26193.1 phosphoenolpyruvate-protein phosphotransferase [Singulisphaera acidiphila DSM 18658]
MHKGIAVSPGVVVGVAYRLDSVFGSSEPQCLESPESIPAEVERFDRAVELSATELEAIVVKVAQQLGGSEADIFKSHLQIVNDQTLLAKVRSLIETQQLTALSALQLVLQSYAATFARIEHDYFRERMTDIRDVISRIGSHLTLQSPLIPTGTHVDGHGDEPVILVAHEILPSQAMSLGNLPIAGIVTETGGGTSHAAILSRSRGIPAVSGVVGITGDVRSGDLMVVDGRDGLVLVRPDRETTAAYRKLQREFFDLKDRLVLNRDQPARSADGSQIELLANINNLADTQAALKVGATGVGLFRTEYLFLTHQDVPDEEEQYQYYRQIIEDSPGCAVTIRTLDLGGDKTVPYLGRRSEANPFMGWRSIRLSFEHPRLFERQIRAILRAGRHGKVNMLFPMITTLEELRYVNKLVEETRRNLRREGVPFGEDVKTGVMVEVPAAAVCIDALLRETDFISIGSNDLIQYLVAADRDNPKVAHLCEPLSPAIFKVLQMVLDACQRTGTPVTLCGEMAGQPRSVLALFGMGLRRFSMSPAFVPTIKALLSSVTTAQAERFAHQVLQLKTSEEIRTYLTARLHEISSALEVFDSA